MLGSFSLFELGIFVFCLLIASYFVGTFLNEIIEREGFGTNGNMVVLTAGALGGIQANAYYGFPQNDYLMIGLWGIAGAFLLVFILMLMKITARKLGM